jgi:hypothetical protein
MLITAVGHLTQRSAEQHRPPFDGPIRLTRQQVGGLLAESGRPVPLDWDAYLSARPTVLGMPVQLVHGVEDSTLWSCWDAL